MFDWITTPAPIAQQYGYACPYCRIWIAGGMQHNCTPQFRSTVSIGCICPPGANLQCERIDCPRKNVVPTAGVTRK